MLEDFFLGLYLVVGFEADDLKDLLWASSGTRIGKGGKDCFSGDLSDILLIVSFEKNAY